MIIEFKVGLCRGGMFALRLFRLIPGNWRCEPEYVDANAWLKSFSPPDDEQCGYELGLSEARLRYDEIVKTYQNMAIRADGFLKTSATISGLVVAATNVFRPPSITWIVAALMCFGVSVLLALVATLPMDRETPPSAKEIINNLQDWDPIHYRPFLAGAYYRATTGTRVLTDWRATNCSVAGALIGLGLLFLIPTVLGF